MELNTVNDLLALAARATSTAAAPASMVGAIVMIGMFVLVAGISVVAGTSTGGAALSSISRCFGMSDIGAPAGQRQSRVSTSHSTVSADTCTIRDWLERVDDVRPAAAGSGDG